MDFCTRQYRTLLQLSATTVLLLAACNIYAATKSLNILTDHESQHQYQSIITSIKSQLLVQGYGQSLMLLSPSTEASQLNDVINKPDSCTISIGAESFKRLQELGAPCSLSLLISKYRFQSSSSQFKKNASAIYLNQPLKRISRVLKLVLKRAEKGSIVISENWPESLALQKPEFDLYIKHLKAGDSVVNAFRLVSQDTDFVIALPDSSVYNRGNIKSILLTTYKAKVPLIGYSDALSRAGALLSIFTPAEQLGKEAAEWFMHGQAKLKASPRFFQVKLNKKVARSLGVKLKNKKLLEQALWEDGNE